MKKVKFTFNYDNDNDVWEGYAHGTTWNGWDNVSVDEKEHKRIEEYFGTQEGSQPQPEMGIKRVKMVYILMLMVLRPL